MSADIVTTAETARRWIYVCVGDVYVAQALAGSMTCYVERGGGGWYVRVGSALLQLRTREAADIVWRACLAALRADGLLVTEQAEGEAPRDLRERHIAALVAAGRIGA